MPKVTFEGFTYLSEVPALLEECIPSLEATRDIIPDKTENGHVIPLIEFGERLGVGDLEIDNAIELGTGYTDFVVLLMEPSDRENIYSIEELVENEKYSYAGQYVNDSLKWASRGRRNIWNTVVMDIRSFRPDRERNCSRETPAQTEFLDSQAYAALMNALFGLHPKVILVCHCDWSGYNDDLGLPRELCSTVKKAGQCWPWTMPNGHKTKVVYGVHPGLIYNQKDYRYRLAIECLLDASFVCAANALVGNSFFGDGLEQLRGIAQEAVDKNKAQPVDPYEDRLLAIRIEFLSRMDPSRAAELAPKLLSAAQAATFISTLELNPQKVEEADDLTLALDLGKMTIGDTRKAIKD